MCILKDCANPTEEGLWWRDDTEWRLYNPHHGALIKNGIAEQLKQIDLGTIVSTVHPSGANYILNLETMEQVAVSSGQRRPVMVVETRPAEPVKRKAPQATSWLPGKSSTDRSQKLYYKDSDGNLQRYHPLIEEALLKSMGLCRVHP